MRNYPALKRSVALKLALLLAGVVAASALNAQVRMLTVGIDVNCPYGLDV